HPASQPGAASDFPATFLIEVGEIRCRQPQFRQSQVFSILNGIIDKQSADALLAMWFLYVQVTQPYGRMQVRGLRAGTALIIYQADAAENIFAAGCDQCLRHCSPQQMQLQALLAQCE